MIQEMKYPQWQSALQDAILEPNPEELRRKVEKIETEIFERFQDLSCYRDRRERQEREALSDALSRLQTLKRDRLALATVDPNELSLP